MSFVLWPKHLDEVYQDPQNAIIWDCDIRFSGLCLILIPKFEESLYTRVKPHMSLWSFIKLT